MAWVKVYILLEEFVIDEFFDGGEGGVVGKGTVVMDSGDCCWVSVVVVVVVLLFFNFMDFIAVSAIAETQQLS